MGLFSKSTKLSESEAALAPSSSNPLTFSNDINPTTTTTTASSSNPSQPQPPRKKSLYARYQDLKRGPGTSNMTDEELKKYTGMDRAEFDRFSASTPGVGGEKAAGDITAGRGGMIGITGGAGAG